MHVCQHTEEGQPACALCTYVIIGAPRHETTSFRTASLRSKSDTPQTPLLLKHAMIANDAERRRSLRMSGIGRRKYIAMVGVQHLLYT